MRREGFYLSFSAVIFLLLLATVLHSFPALRSSEWENVYRMQQGHDLLTVWLLKDSSFVEKISDLEKFGGKWKLEQEGQSWGENAEGRAIAVEGLFVKNRSLEPIRLTRFEDD